MLTRLVPVGAALALVLALALAPGAGTAAPTGPEVPLRLAPATPTGVAGAAVVRSLERRERVPVVVALRSPTLPALRRLQHRRATVADVQRRVLRRLPRGSFELTARWDVTPGFAGTVTREGLRRLLRAPEVARVDVDRRVRAALGQSAPLIRADVAHASGATGAGVTVAVIDTGIDTDHPDLAGDLVGEQCFAHLASGAGGCPNGQGVQSGPGSAEDDEGHGTSVSGIITSDGVVSPKGVAPAAKIVAVKVLSRDGSGSTADIVSGLDWVLTNRPDVKVVNMSLGGDELFSTACDEASAITIMQASVMRALRSRGVTVFVASGNDGASTQVGQPACVESAVSVGAVYDANIGPVNFGRCSDTTTAPDKVICISNAGNRLDLLAPGGETTAPALGGGKDASYGTSDAAPHAAGVAALMLQVRPDLSPDQVEATLKSTGVPVVDSRTGATYPRVDAAAAVAAVPSLPAPPAPPPYLPSTTATYADATGDAAGGPDVGQVSVASSPDGLLTVSVEVPNRTALLSSETVWVTLDLDRNAATGGRGGEFALVLRPGGTTELARWGGASWRFVRTLAQTTRSANTLTFRISQDELGSRSDFAVRVVGQTGTVVADISPNAGDWPFPAVPLVVQRTGSGGGTVAGGGVNGIGCGTVCSALFGRAATVALTATPLAGSVFAGWEGACGGTAPCTLALADATTVIARFELLRRVSVATAGTGRGSVASAPGGIACGAACAAMFANGTTLTLTPEPEAGSRFDGWSGSCTGSSPCSFAVDGDRTLTAVFADVAAPRISVSRASGRRGRLVRLRYRASDNSGRVRLEVDVLRGRKAVRRIRRDVLAEGRAASVEWFVPKRFKGGARFCVRARDAAGNVGNRACAQVRVRG